MITLEEAINSAHDVGYTECEEWLKELKNRRERDARCQYVIEKSGLDDVEFLTAVCNQKERMIREANLRKIINRYGFMNQREQFSEECAEAILAIQKFKRFRGEKDVWENMKEEVADVIVMAEQMRLIIGADEIDKIIHRKIKRQLERIKKEQEETN